MAKLKINCKPVVPPEESLRHIEYAVGLGLPFVSEKERPPLAVVGGGHSIRYSLEEVRAFEGDRWIIGSAFKWWREQGIDGTFFSVHPSNAALNNIEGVSKALLSSNTHPDVLDALKGADVELFHLLRDGQVLHGSTTATVAPVLSLEMGYRDVTFFGCDSCYAKDATHHYMNAPDPFAMIVQVGDDKYLTGAEFLMQAEFLSALIVEAPLAFKERSGGLLKALVRSRGEYDVVKISKQLYENRSAA